jgi:hypothetical protein
MSKLWHLVLVVIAMNCLSVQAAEGKLKKEDFSGFLGDYSKLVYIKKQNAFKWVNKEATGKYQKVYLEPIVVYPVDQVNVDIAVKATQHLAKGVQKILDKKGLSAEEKGPGVLQLSAAITSTSKQKVGMKARNFIPVALVFKAGQAATGNVATYIEVSMEAELIDSETGERLLATVQRGVADTKKTSGDKFTYEDVIPVLDKWLATFERSISTVL